jgi:DNA-directed RNA polymerase specialized sigma24 family protein
VAAASSKTTEPLPAGKALSAMLALLVAEREDHLAKTQANGDSLRKTELILAASGLSALEIAPLVDKNVDAVRKTIQRGRK